MKKICVFVPWREGLHIRPAMQLVQCVRGLRSRVSFCAGQRVADGRSILSILALCAVFNTVIEIRASGEDEEVAIRVVEALFVEAAGATSPQPAGPGDLPLT